MQVFLQLNSPLSPILTSATFNITANVGLVVPATATGAQLLTGIPVTVNASAVVLTLTPVGAPPCDNPIDIWITQPTTTTTTTADPGICFSWYAPFPSSFSQNISPGTFYAGKPTYIIPSLGTIYWSPSDLRWEFSSLLDSGTLYSYMNNNTPTPISGSPNNWVDATPSIQSDPRIINSLFGICPPPTTTTTSTTTSSTTTSTTLAPTTTTTSSTTSTSTTSTTSTTTSVPNCCAPTISSVLLNSGTGQLNVSYSLGTSQSCSPCSSLRLEYSTDNGTSWVLASITSSCSSTGTITVSSKPNGTLFRLQTNCGGVTSPWSTSVAYNNCCPATITGITENLTNCTITVNINYPAAPCPSCNGQSIEYSTNGAAGPFTSFSPNSCTTPRTISMTNIPAGVTHIRTTTMCTGGGMASSAPFPYTKNAACANQKTISNTTINIGNAVVGSFICSSWNCGASCPAISAISLNGSALSPLNQSSNNCDGGVCNSFPLASGQLGRKLNFSATSKGNGKFDVIINTNFRSSGTCVYAYVRVGTPSTSFYFPTNYTETIACLASNNLAPVVTVPDVDINSGDQVTILLFCIGNGCCSCTGSNC